ncbi:MAG: UDP-N-acetylglucosamine 1-carboxyvinyltransferase [Clostridia bacterium]|nr:UDP-N-acetylglucosamine 1-carboxyvinyltransferase [Clostridia bacterium]
MEAFKIKGGNKLQGKVHISGAKNAAVAIVPASILINGVCRIENLPDIADVNYILEILAKLGSKISRIDNHTVEIDNTNITTYKATDEIVQRMRASYYLVGALLGRFKRADVSLPGGCNFGERPIDLHIKGFKKLGAEVNVSDSFEAHAQRLIGTSIYLDQVSVGATMNIMIAAVLAEGITTIENAAKEPHIVDVANFLNSMGADIKGAGTDTIKIRGVKELHGGTYSLIPDQIEVGTFMMASVITGGDVTVEGVIPKHMEAIVAKLIEMGAQIIEDDESIRVIGPEIIKHTNVKTMPYPGFPTDLQPIIVALLALAVGTSIVNENVWENRFQYVDELRRLGANIIVTGRTAVIQGVPAYEGSKVKATDLRAGAAMVLSALAAKGETIVHDIKYIDRGYEYFEDKLKKLGADIERVEVQK